MKCTELQKYFVLVLACGSLLILWVALLILGFPYEIHHIIACCDKENMHLGSAILITNLTILLLLVLGIYHGVIETCKIVSKVDNNYNNHLCPWRIPVVYALGLLAILSSIVSIVGAGISTNLKLANKQEYLLIPAFLPAFSAASLFIGWLLYELVGCCQAEVWGECRLLCPRPAEDKEETVVSVSDTGVSSV
jgi:hypothetical protein